MATGGIFQLIESNQSADTPKHLISTPPSPPTEGAKKSTIFEYISQMNKEIVKRISTTINKRKT